jgi:hypothetical protein
VQYGQDGTVGHRVEELVGMPARGQRTGLGLTVPDHAHHQQVGIVECRSECVDQRVAEFPALVDRTGCLRCDVTGNSAWEGELAKERTNAILVPSDGRVDLAVGAVQIGVGHQPRTAVAGSGHVERIEVPVFDRSIHVCVQQVEPWRGAPVAQETGFDVLGQERFTQQRIVEQVDLPHRQVVRSPPIPVDQVELLRAQSSSGRGSGVDDGQVVHR